MYADKSVAIKIIRSADRKKHITRRDDEVDFYE